MWFRYAGICMHFLIPSKHMLLLLLLLFNFGCNVVSIYPLQEPIFKFLKFQQPIRHLKMNKCLADEGFGLLLNVQLT